MKFPCEHCRLTAMKFPIGWKTFKSVSHVLRCNALPQNACVWCFKLRTKSVLTITKTKYNMSHTLKGGGDLTFWNIILFI